MHRSSPLPLLCLCLLAFLSPSPAAAFDPGVSCTGAVIDALAGLAAGTPARCTETVVDEADPGAAAALVDAGRVLAPDVDPWRALGRMLAMPPSLPMPEVEVERGDLPGLARAMETLLDHLVEARSAGRLSEEDGEALERRVGLLGDFFQAQAEKPPVEDPRRLAAVLLALSQVGQVKARLGGEVDAETGRTQRVGWRRLMEYFTVAFERMWPALEAQIRFVKNPYPPHWCGIFCWWALKSAGFDLPPWPMGKGIYGSVPLRPSKAAARVGDICYDGGKYDHMSLVVSLEGDRLTTVDGNTIRDDRPVGGEVWPKPRKSLARMSAIFSPVED